MQSVPSRYSRLQRRVTAAQRRQNLRCPSPQPYQPMKEHFYHHCIRRDAVQQPLAFSSLGILSLGAQKWRLQLCGLSAWSFAAVKNWWKQGFNFNISLNIERPLRVLLGIEDEKPYLVDQYILQPLQR